MKANPNWKKAGNTCLPKHLSSPANGVDPLLKLPQDAAFVEHCKSLARSRLAGPAARLFKEQTGAPLRVIWSPKANLDWEDTTPAFLSDSCPDVPVPAAPDQLCTLADHCHLLGLLKSRHCSGEFVCHAGIRTIARKITPADFLLGIAFCQIHEYPATGTPRLRTDLPKLRNLLRFVVHDAEETVLSISGRELIDRLCDELTASRNEERNLRSVIRRMAPAISGIHHPEQPRSHRELLVARMLEYAENHYGQPLGLDDLAREMRMNRSYLSHLFSTSMGIPFRSYVKQLRMDRARELLTHPQLRIADVAYRVGYTDPNRFRLDFKQHTALAPSKWRTRQEPNIPTVHPK
ncbi:MAG: helix-turn-helix transcriptional regulator [Verrucomicrobiales bacterium]|nr:AraC family transcriptional regulator [Verrucomicrobiota bacterium JB025]